jgi:membrane protease YdiL (CAAX protease family)
MPELAVASGPLCGAALFVVLTGGRIPRARISASAHALALRWAWLGVAAALEELVWRGLVLPVLAAPLGTAAALAISAAAFALWHRAALGRRCGVHVLTGLGFGGAFVLGGLAAAMLAHAVYNVLVDWAVHAHRAAA